MLRTAHRWLGLLLALPLLLQGITGVILVTLPMVERLALPDVTSAGPTQGVAAIVAAARAAARPGLVPLRYQAEGVAVVDLARPQQSRAEARVLVDPVTLAILGIQVHPGTVYRLVHRLHETLLIDGPLGHSAIGWVGILLALMGVSGIPIWWPRPGRWAAALTVSSKVRGPRLVRDLHGAAGAWLVVLLLVQAIGGASMAFPQSFRAMLGVVPPPAFDRHGSHGDAPSPDLDAAVATARAALPGFEVTDLRMVPGRPILLRLKPTGATSDAPPGVVLLDAAGRQVLSVEDPRRASAAAALLAWLRVLHEGDGLGPVWRGLIILAGIALPVLAVTGTMTWLLRRRLRRRLTQPAAAE